MSKGCPNRCGKHIPDNNEFCSAKCFKEYHELPPDMPIKQCLERTGRTEDIPEEDVL